MKKQLPAHLYPAQVSYLVSNSMIKTMKKFSFFCLPLLLLILFAMNASGQTIKNYDQEWKKVEDLVKKGLPKSAYEEVQKIYAMAVRDKQEAQIIKALVYRINVQDETREDNAANAIKELEKELPGKSPAVQAVLHSLLAGVYQNYFEQHRWELNNRTETTNFVKEDIATWTSGDLYKYTVDHYRQSISNEKILQQTSLAPYDAILIKGNVRHLRPTLYDLLVHRALDYLQNADYAHAKPTYAFEMDQASAFDPAADFIHRRFGTQDTTSSGYLALLIYQKLLAFHLNDAKPDALIDADIKRIQYVYGRSTHPDKEELYFNAINHLAHQYNQTPAAAQAWYLTALYYQQQGQQYKPYGDSTHRLDLIKARDICRQVIAQKDSSEGKINATNLLRELEAEEVTFRVENVNLPGQAFRSLITYKNVGRLYLKLVKSTPALRQQLEGKADAQYWPLIMKGETVRTWEQDLPQSGDLQSNHVEIKVDGLPVGEYFLVAGAAKDPLQRSHPIASQLFYVSNISYILNDNDVFVLDRDKGTPLAGAKVQVWERKYDYQQSKYISTKGKLYTADKNGFVRLDSATGKINENRYTNYAFRLEVTYQQDRLFMENEVNRYYYRDMDEADQYLTRAVHLFTDRSIYRPGQVVYFKGIGVVHKKGETKSAILTQYKTQIYLKDVNDQVVDSINVETSAFGSFSGRFTLPTTGLNGYFTLEMRNNEGTVSFNVEDYKRPKFEVTYDTLKGTYTIDEEITVKGNAKAYAGNAVDGAQVNYRVVRQPRFPYPWLFSRWWLPPTRAQEIANGTTTTDAEGRFVIRFKAIADKSIDKKLEPLFTYTITADVTDINGETRSGEEQVSVGYKSLWIESSIPETMPADSLKRLYILTKNTAGTFEPTTVRVKISRLQEEKRLIRPRLWDRPTQFSMSKAAYVQAFPNDEYNNEADKTQWPTAGVVWEKADSTQANGSWVLKDAKFQPGFYLIEVVTYDKKGAEVKDKKYVRLYDPKSKTIPGTDYLWVDGAERTEPGQTAEIKIGTSAGDVNVIQLTKKIDQQKETYSFFRLNNEKKELQFPVTEADRGGISTGFVFIRNNRVFQRQETINVPWSNKTLETEYMSYRDKTLPGSQEQWKVKIKGHKGEQVAAEMLASMYDASLDQFVPHSWSVPSIWPTISATGLWNDHENFTAGNSRFRYREYTRQLYVRKQYDYLVTINIDNNRVYMMARKEVMAAPSLGMDLSAATPGLKTQNAASDTMAFTANGAGDVKDEVMQEQQKQAEVQVRRNLQETAFFFPDLKTDKDGNIEFSFTMPEALTRWKLQTLSHTQDLAFGYSTRELVTQKDIMVQPNPVRFLREGDKLEFSAKVVNMTDKEVTGTAEFRLFDAATNEPVDGQFKSMVADQYFTVGPKGSEALKFPVEVPFQFARPVIWRVIVRAGNQSDGEENSLPVLTNRMLVTESLPIWIKGNGTKNFKFDKLLKSGNSETLQHQGITVEYSSNPAWYAVQALPYLMEYPYECAEQTWNRYYANSLANSIVGSSPRIRQVFEQWKNKDTAALLSNLQKNEELKAVLLNETPWVLQARTEAEQKKNIALLFDMVRMSAELQKAYQKLSELQSSNGGFVWFKGGPDDRYMTQYIVTGIAHLLKLNAATAEQKDQLTAMAQRSLQYLDRKIKEDYDELVRFKTDLTKYVPGHIQVQYLYMRSFFPATPVATEARKAYDYFRSRTIATWTGMDKYRQGMIALALHRTNDTKTPAAILRSLKETSIVSEELGRYWKDQRRGWWWYEAPIERQALLIEAFSEAGKDTVTVDELRTWLLRNKQTNSWESTKATAEACYALLLRGTNWLTETPAVQIKLGRTTISPSAEDVQAGTGYFRREIEGLSVRPDMGNIDVTVSNAKTTSWGSVYWQYFEDLDKITSAATPLQLKKQLFVERNTDKGPVLTPIREGDALKVGDKLKVRIELRVDRDMEYVHMKDMRASGFEPVNVLSGYKWQGGLGYYESTRDAATHFFFNFLGKGTYVFEYPLFVAQNGNFSNGITQIQCMYAPEFTAHSEGVRVQVGN